MIDIRKNIRQLDLSRTERYIHLGLWILGFILLNIPSFNLTVGLFRGGDLSLLLPSIYGTIINAALFYAVIGLIIKIHAERTYKDFGKIFYFLLLSVLLESTLDALSALILNISLNIDLIIDEMLIGNSLMHMLFFMLPAVFYATVKAVMKDNKELVKGPKDITVKENGRNKIIPLADINYIEAEGNYVKYHLEKGFVLERNSLSKVESKLPEKFIRIHRSFIVNKLSVQEYNSEEVLVGGHVLSVGRKYKNNLKGV